MSGVRRGGGCPDRRHHYGVAMLFLFAVFCGDSQIRVPGLGPALELVTPGVEELALHAQLACQFMYVLAGLHSFDDLSLEFQGVTTPLWLLCHSCTPFAAKCVYSECLTLGVQSITKVMQSGLIGVNLRSSAANNAFRFQLSPIERGCLNQSIRTSTVPTTALPEYRGSN